MPPRKVWANKVEDRQSKKTKEKNPEERVLIVNRPLIRDWLSEELYAGGRIAVIARDRDL
jgi:hypothetical protein